MYYVYILKLSTNKTYIGCTNNLKSRIKRHNQGEVKTTKGLKPKLVGYLAIQDRYTAYNFEQYLKSGSGRAFIKKHKLI